MKIKLILICFFCFYLMLAENSGFVLFAQTAGLYEQVFIENKGQWDTDVLFLCRLKGCDIWITKKGLNYFFYDINDQDGTTELHRLRYNPKNGDSLPEMQRRLQGYRVILSFEDANPNFTYEGISQEETYYNFFKCLDTGYLAVKAHLYKEIMLKNLWQGIDVRYFFQDGFLCGELMVESGAKLSQIKFSLSGHLLDQIKSKRLYLKTSWEEIPFLEWNTFQEEQIVPCNLKKTGKVYVFESQYYDHKKPVRLNLLFCPETKEVKNDIFARDIEFKNGSIYIGGHWTSPVYEIKPGSVIIPDGKFYDVFVMKLNPEAGKMVFASFFIGDDQDEGHAIAIDDDGNIYVTGITFSKNFPLSEDAFQKVNKGYGDIFVTKLSNDGSKVLYSSFLGGKFNDEANDLVVDPSGNICLTGITTSWDFPVSPDAFQSKHKASFSDAFVLILNPNSSSLEYSTYLGGTSGDDGLAIALDKEGLIYVVGRTSSEDFYLTDNAFQKVRNSDAIFNMFLSIFSLNHKQIVYSTYLGGSDEDVPLDISVDDSGNVYVVGYTSSQDFPVTGQVFQSIFGGGEYDGFCLKFNRTNGLISSTYLGGKGNDKAISLAVNSKNEVIITGYTNSLGFMECSEISRHSKTLNKDVFIMKFSSDFSKMLYGVCMGSGKDDEPSSLTTNSDHIFVLINSNSENELYTYLEKTAKLDIKGLYPIWLKMYEP